VLEVERRISTVMFSLMLIMGFLMLVDRALGLLLWLRWEGSKRED
jgi:hypothetical protein